jgi:hypothetical protein
VDPTINIQLSPKGAAGAVVGPAAAAFIIDASGGQNINLGGTTGTNTINIGRTGQIAALLGNVTVAGDVNVNVGKFTITAATGATAIAGDVNVNAGKFVITAATGATAIAGDVNVNAGRFTVAAATGNTVIGGTLIGSGSTGFLIDASGTTPTIGIGTGAGSGAVTLSRTGVLTTIAGNAQVTGTFTVAATGTALNEIRFGTCAIPATNVPAAGGGGVNTTCTITGGVQNLQAYQVSVTPAGNLPANITYSVNFPTATAIIIRWVNGGALVSTGALTFKWTAVR